MSISVCLLSISHAAPAVVSYSSTSVSWGSVKTDLGYPQVQEKRKSGNKEQRNPLGSLEFDPRSCGPWCWDAIRFGSFLASTTFFCYRFLSQLASGLIIRNENIVCLAPGFQSSSFLPLPHAPPTPTSSGIRKPGVCGPHVTADFM